MPDLISEFYEKGKFDVSAGGESLDEALRDCIRLLEARGFLKGLTYQWFIGMMARMKKAVQF